MSNLREAAQQALEALETPIQEQTFMQKQNAITALKAALEAALAEPMQTITSADQERGMARPFERTSGQQTARRTT